MATGHDAATRGVGTLLGLGAIGDRTDGQLLERFATDRGEAAGLAFAAIVERHGPVVLRACRAILRDEHEAHDAFQATFLVLVKKARSLWVRDSLGPWLHQVACRAARYARSARARRRDHERRAAAMTPDRAADVGDRDDLAEAMHEEVGRLPARYRDAIVLCDLGGGTHEAAARHLGCPVGTVKSRLARGRALLRSRLARRGLAPSAGLLAAESAGAAMSMPPGLLDATTRAAVALAGRAPMVGVVSAGVAGLVGELSRSLLMGRWKWIAASMAAVGLVAGGAASRQDRGEATSPAPQAEAKAKPKREVPRPPEGPRPQSRPDAVNEVEGTTTILSILPEGTMVKKGDIVCELDAATLHDRLLNQKITIVQAEANYRNAQLVREAAEIANREFTDGDVPRERASTEGAIELAKAELAWAEERIKWMEGNGPAAGLRIGLREAELDRLRARNALRDAEARLDILTKYTVPRRTITLKLDIERATGDELMKKSTVALERDREKHLARQIEQCTVRSPADGKVVHANDIHPVSKARRILIEEGASVRERQILFRVVSEGATAPKE